MDTFARLAYDTASTAHESLITLRIHTFACPSCPDFIKEEACLSDGLYCAYSPKRNDFWVEQKDSEDIAPTSNTLYYFTGRELLLSSLQEKCLHTLIQRDLKAANVTADLEELFFAELSDRVKKCERQTVSNGSYSYECLFSTPKRFKSYQS